MYSNQEFDDRGLLKSKARYLISHILNSVKMNTFAKSK